MCNPTDVSVKGLSMVITCAIEIRAYLSLHEPIYFKRIMDSTRFYLNKYTIYRKITHMSCRQQNATGSDVDVLHGAGGGGRLKA